MAAPQRARDITQLWQQGIRSAHQFDERTHGWLGMFASAAKQTLTHNSAITAAAIAYFMLPHGASTWREVLPGAIVTGLLWELAK